MKQLSARHWHQLTLPQSLLSPAGATCHKHPLSLFDSICLSRLSSVCLSVCLSLCMPVDKPLFYSTMQICDWTPVARSDLYLDTLIFASGIIITAGFIFHIMSNTFNWIQYEKFIPYIFSVAINLSINCLKINGLKFSNRLNILNAQQLKRWALGKRRPHWNESDQLPCL